MAAPDSDASLLEEIKASFPAQLPSYLVQQRWFGGKARRIRTADVVDFVTVNAENPQALFLLVRVEYETGPADLYSIPLVVELPTSPPAGGEPVLKLARQHPQQSLIFSDALKNESFLSILLAAIQYGKSFHSGLGSLRAAKTHSFPEISLAPLRARVIKAEQSNSSIVYGDQFILKLFRRLEEGSNPDLEMGAFLTGPANFLNTPKILGFLEYCAAAGQRMTQGILQTFVPNQGDAWQYTLKNVGNYYQSASRHPPETGGRDSQQAQATLDQYFNSVELLALRTAEMHRALASDSANPDFAPERFEEKSQKKFAASLAALTEGVFAQLPHQIERLPVEMRSAASRLAARKQEILERFKQALLDPVDAMRIRIHGDYHLGQVLYTGSDFVIIDFEGEPARPLAERRLKRSALQDVAGMLRSFHYAAYAPLLTPVQSRTVPIENNLREVAAQWYALVSERFLEQYLKSSQGAGYLPRNREKLNELLRLHILEKAVYELGYELNNRPGWVGIPMEGISQALAA